MLLNETTLTQYALGILDDDECKKIKLELRSSPEQQRELESIQDSLHFLSYAEKPLRPSNRLRNLVMDSTSTKSRFSGFVDRFTKLFDIDQEQTLNLFAKIDAVSDPAWETSLFPGVRLLKFNGGPQLASATCGIVQVKPGKIFPAHQHQGDEWILVLQGRAREDSSRIFAAGDMCRFPTGSTHTFRIMSDEDFIFSVILEQDNRWLIGKTLLDHIFAKQRFGKE